MAPHGRVAEVFRSYQGEGLLLGRRQVFVRLAGCTVGCRYCDTAWAFETPATVAVPHAPRLANPATVTVPRAPRLANPLRVDDVVALVDRADPPADGSRCPVSLTGGEPLEQADFSAALCARLAAAGRDVMLETAALDAAALAAVVPHVRWVAADLKLPSATGLPDVLERHEHVLASGVLDGRETFFKLVVDGDVTVAEVARAAALLARHAPAAPVFVQPVTPLGGSPSLPRERLDELVDVLVVRGLAVRVVPQVHKVLGVR